MPDAEKKEAPTFAKVGETDHYSFHCRFSQNRLESHTYICNIMNMIHIIKR